MTREEAVARVQSIKGSGVIGENFVDMLVALGLLHLETTTDKDWVAAAERLQGCFVGLQDRCGAPSDPKRLSKDGAYEVLDILTNSGFKITKDA